MTARSTLALGGMLLVALLSACEQKPKYENSAYGIKPSQIQFKNSAPTNRNATLEELSFELVSSSGETIDIAEYHKQGKNLLFIFMRGWNAQIGVCPYCTAQTARLIRQYEEFEKRDTEILVVYPGPEQRVPQFVSAVNAETKNLNIPFKILLDTDAKVVNELGISSDLAKPSTFLIDKQGKVRYAYVGRSTGDRPSIFAILQELDQLAAAKPAQPEEAKSSPEATPAKAE